MHPLSAGHSCQFQAPHNGLAAEAFAQTSEDNRKLKTRRMWLASSLASLGCAILYHPFKLAKAGSCLSG